MKKNKEENIVLSFEFPEEVAYFIAESESGLYGGANVDGESIHIHLEKGEGMTVTTNQSNGWIRSSEYNKVGIKISELYEGRWDR